MILDPWSLILDPVIRWSSDSVILDPVFLGSPQKTQIISVRKKIWSISASKLKALWNHNHSIRPKCTKDGSTLQCRIAEFELAYSKWLEKWDHILTVCYILLGKSKLEKHIKLPLLKYVMGVFFFRMVSAHVLNFCVYRE